LIKIVNFFSKSRGKLVQRTLVHKSVPAYGVIRCFSAGTPCESAWKYPVKARIQHPAPKFEGMSFFKDGFKKISLDDYKGKYVVLFFYPLDFTFVCPTEIIEFNKKAEEFRKIGCEVIACSVDSHFTH